MIEIPHEIKIGVPIMLSELKGNLEREDKVPADMSTADIFREAAGVAVNHWMITVEDHRLRCAVGCTLLLLMDDDRHEEKLLLERELSVLAALNAAATGVPVDFGRVLEHPEDAEKFAGILRIWQEIRDSGASKN